MRILLDESLPLKLKYDFDSLHEVLTVRDMGWLGKKNGILIKLLVEHSFKAFVTVDRNLTFQQNIHHLPFIIFVLRAKNNRYQTLAKLIPKLLHRIDQTNTENVVEIF